MQSARNYGGRVAESRGLGGRLFEQPQDMSAIRRIIAAHDGQQAAFGIVQPVQCFGMMAELQQSIGQIARPILRQAESA